MLKGHSIAVEWALGSTWGDNAPGLAWSYLLASSLVGQKGVGEHLWWWHGLHHIVGFGHPLHQYCGSTFVFYPWAHVWVASCELSVLKFDRFKCENFLSKMTFVSLIKVVVCIKFIERVNIRDFVNQTREDTEILITSLFVNWPYMCIFMSKQKYFTPIGMLNKVPVVYIWLIGKVVISLELWPPNSPCDCKRVVQYCRYFYSAWIY